VLARGIQAPLDGAATSAVREERPTGSPLSNYIIPFHDTMPAKSRSSRAILAGDRSEKRPAARLPALLPRPVW
jgi:hypothetical protein